MEVIPAIDLLAGQCVRLHRGDYAQVEVVAADPLQQAQLWREQGATRLHVVDLEGARSGDPVHVNTIQAIVETVQMPVQVGGGIRSLRTAEQWLAAGVDRVIVGTLAVEDPQLVQTLCQRHPQRIVVGIDAREGQVATRGWLTTSTVAAVDLVRQANDWGAAAIIYTDIQRDGTLSGPNLTQLRTVAEVSQIPVIASGGISSLTDLLSLLTLVPLGVSGVIVGKALYSGNFQLKEAIRAVGSGRWQDVPDSPPFLA